MATKLLKINDKQFNSALKKLIKKIKKLNLDPEKTLVIGVARGGLMAAQYLAYALDIKNIITFQSKLYKENNTRDEIHEISGTALLDFNFDNYVVVDDLYDSGITINNIRTLLIDTLTEKGNTNFNVVPAVVFTKNKKASNQEDIVFGKVISIRDWANFPWDRL